MTIKIAFTGHRPNKIPGGGTANCIKYAQDKNVKIRNIYDEYRSI